MEKEIKMGETTPEEQNPWEGYEKKIQNMEKQAGEKDKEEFQDDVEEIFDELDGASIERGHELYQEFFSKWDKRIDLPK